MPNSVYFLYSLPLAAVACNPLLNHPTWFVAYVGTEISRGGGGGGAGPHTATLMVSMTTLVVQRVYH